MDANGSQGAPAASGGGGAPTKPWERAGSSNGPSPFKPSSAGRTSDVVEASGTAKPGEIVSNADNRTGGVNTNSVGRPLPARPWENNVGGYNSGMNNGLGVGSGMYNSYGSSGYGGGMYGSGGVGGGMYGSGIGGGMYGSSLYNRGGYGGGLYGGGGAYGGGMYGNSYGSSMGGYGGMGMGMGGMGMGGPYGGQDPNNPYGEPPSPPGFWISFLRVMQGVVNFFGRISILIDQNTQAVHLFMSALLQLADRGGLLYGEMARFVMRLLGYKRGKSIRKDGEQQQQQQRMGGNGGPMAGLPGPEQQRYLEGPRSGGGGNPPWDNVWGN